MSNHEDTPSTRTPGARRQPAARATPSTLRTVEKRADAIRLRITGLSYQAIADRLGYNDKSAAFKAVESGRRAILAEPAADLVALELERLDALMEAYWSKALAGDVQAFDRVLRVMERRARYLGLDAPARTEQSGDGIIQVLFHPALAGPPVVESGVEEGL